MKKLITAALAAALLAACLSGCGSEAASPHSQETQTTSPTTQVTTEATPETTETATVPETTQPAATQSTTEPEATESATQPPQETTTPPAFTPYTVFLPYECPVFDRAGYDGRYVQAIGTDGVYTITEEATVEQVLWGKLKSGTGWVDLTKTKVPATMTVGYAEGKILELDSHSITVESGQHATKLVFRAYGSLVDVRLTSLQHNGNTYIPSKTLYILPSMEPEKPLIAELVFHGDMTAYGISFVDINGQAYHYAVTVSGRNSSLVFTEYTP